MTTDARFDLGELLAQTAGQPKPWWQSRTLIGAGVVLLASVARLVAPEIAIDVNATTDAALSALTLLGGALAWWGRVRATRPIRRRRPAADADTDAGRLRELPPDADRAAGVYLSHEHGAHEHGPLDP